MRLYFIIIWSLASCTVADLHDAQQIVDKSIKAHGGGKFSNSKIEFDFRGRHYIAKRDNGKFSYERVFIEDNDTIHDYLTNDRFYREINSKSAAVADSMAAKYSRSVNATIYFASLPYGLNDNAVEKKFLGETIIDNQPYYKVEVTFKKEGGGEDFTDVFHYWFHKEKFTMDYFAYVYYTEEGGIRFRKAIKQHAKSGMLLQDYINYQPVDSTATLVNIEEHYKHGKLKELSRIELENVEVN